MTQTLSTTGICVEERVRDIFQSISSDNTHDTTVCKLIMEYVNEQNHTENEGNGDHEGKTTVPTTTITTNVKEVPPIITTLDESKKTNEHVIATKVWLVSKDHPTLRYLLDVNFLHIEICPLTGKSIPSYSWVYDNRALTWSYGYTRQTGEEVPLCTSNLPPSISRLETVCQIMSGARRDKPFEMYEDYSFHIPAPLMDVIQNQDILTSKYTFEVESLFALEQLFSKSAVDRCITESKEGLGLRFIEALDDDDGYPKLSLLMDYDSRWSMLPKSGKKSLQHRRVSKKPFSKGRKSKRVSK